MERTEFLETVNDLIFTQGKSIEDVKDFLKNKGLNKDEIVSVLQDFTKLKKKERRKSALVDFIAAMTAIIVGIVFIECSDDGYLPESFLKLGITLIIIAFLVIIRGLFLKAIVQ
ncbi:MAG: hypothetical protein LBK94_03650 [Prevotellaceae bacterium]|jgi:hypothetical protein|nr:hypothetical protein [Prevotellaceae bacterium]